MKTQGATIPKLYDKYRKEIVPAMMKRFNFKSVMQVPHLEKVVINMGVKEGKDDIKILDQIAVELGLISGQKPYVAKAKKSISAFKLREGSPIGLKVTLRRARMYEFLERLFNVAMPRIRDFRGYPDTSFDGNGNYTFGVQEQIIFPEVEFVKIKKTQGMDITFVTSTSSDEEAKELLLLLGMPFKKK
ncbi:MAG: 50S ribosomal protein L5 [Candidatus Omnitrophica bacterium]|nr:50S ribosomal protein L5 [Candidatus Omnitrophota bacterium]